MKLISGEVINKTVLTDANGLAIINPVSVGLTLSSISAMRGGKATLESSLGLTYSPVPVRVVLEDNKRKFCDLYEGVYTVHFHQVLKSFPEDIMLSIESSLSLTKTGAYIVPQKYYKYHSMGNLTALLVIPSSCHVTFEIGTNIAELYMIPIDVI
jgi:hypothetical protein